MWMVRSATGGSLADEFKEKGVVAIGWDLIGNLEQFSGNYRGQVRVVFWKACYGLR